MSESPDSPPPPRALCHATGFIFQAVGPVLALGACCWWSFSGHCDSSSHSRPGILDVVSLRQSAPELLWGMLATTISLVGGLALTALGISLQHDMSRSGRAAKWTTGLIAAFFGCYLGVAVLKFPSVARIVTGAVLAVVWTVIFLLAGAASEQLRRYPPPRRDSTWTSRDEDDLRKGPSPPAPGKKNP